MRKSILSILMILFFKGVDAQINISSLHNQNCDLENTFINPSLVGNEYKNIKVSVLPIYFNIGNNFTSAADIYDYYRAFDKQSLTNEFDPSPINSIMNNLKKDNIIYAGADVTVLNVGFNLNHNRKRMLEVQLSARQHVQANVAFSDELLTLLYKGNKYYENQTIDVLPKINMLQYGDFGVNIAKPFTIKFSDSLTFLIKPAVRLRYLVGTANVNTQNSSLDLYTAPEGRYLDATLNGQVQMSYINTDNLDNINGKSISSVFSKGAGTGFGFDIGASIKVNERLNAGFALVDNGKIKFKENAYTISSNSTVKWEGYDLNSNMDSFFNQKDLLKLDSTAGSYSVGIGSKLVLNGSYGFGKKQKFKRYLNHYHHTVSAYYIQGFSNYLNATKTPLLSVGYSYRLKNILNAGINACVGGLTRASLGAHVHFGLGPLHIGLATNSLGTIINRYASKGLDFQLYTAFCF